ncbi:hypothetical protein GCM10011578_071000 [Streptomyces fuscichromogenes]|uniref:Uncharacterized protein n=1 Tax=Streptomyces fuscichromogenes TaxID=1324013 RepID=A0A917XJ93_9ACTN|nr:hypothetical protein GCM10011578_071000 [Streptomyces fuscichromogenes]
MSGPPGAGSREPKGGRRKAEGESREARAGRREPGAERRKAEGGRRQARAGRREPEAGSRKAGGRQAAGGRRQAAGGRRSVAGVGPEWGVVVKERMTDDSASAGRRVLDRASRDGGVPPYDLYPAEPSRARCAGPGGTAVAPGAPTR